MTITIDTDVFGYDDLDESFETCEVSGGHDTAAVVAALERAAVRIFKVGEDGVERRTEAELDAAAAADVYTPNYVSDPEVTDGGVRLYVDCKGFIDPVMGNAMRRVLRQELERVGGDLRVRAVTY